MWTSIHRFGSSTLVVLVVFQAVIAGQYLFGDWGIGLHAGLGNAVFTIAVLLTVIAFARLDGGALGIVALIILVLVSAQIGLGYSARDSRGAAALHIPLGVAVFGAIGYQLLMVWPALIRRQDTADD